ncbi:hypothetical protein [Rhodococcoides corynebacterioides]|uniref:Uncharacterized protein n=1 Tax=Rhodococcoides corynebacterioides TaxID=53972 RepID=A0ABS7P8L2_9NOCA|nr:hypothetical protein [Rhodococcus corynebacterioides]MBY6368772.1 hypothetical protein [Rhodococcus corynebacterioides]MBY6409912.1 hypothetical protein [Rhodococcus corynebacterioides]
MTLGGASVEVGIAELYEIASGVPGQVPSVVHGPTTRGLDVSTPAPSLSRGRRAQVTDLVRRLCGAVDLVEIRVVGHAPGVADLRGCLVRQVDTDLWVTRRGDTIAISETGSGRSMLTAALGVCAGRAVDEVTDTPSVVADRVSRMTTDRVRHAEIVALRGESRRWPVVAVVDTPAGRTLTVTRASVTGLRTTLQSGTAPRIGAAVQAVLAAASGADAGRDCPRAQGVAPAVIAGPLYPIGSSGVRLPFVSNGGV